MNLKCDRAHPVTCTCYLLAFSFHASSAAGDCKNHFSVNHMLLTVREILPEIDDGILYIPAI